MEFSKLPKIKDKTLELAHFPTRFHAVVFRLWELVPLGRIAYALNISESDVTEAAFEMGLPPQKCNENWLTRGYITIIRNVWHLLPYENLLKLLDYSEDELATVLKEDDFLEWKLGGFKPYCPPIVKEELDTEGRARLLKIKECVQANFSEIFDGQEPFKFFKDRVEPKEFSESDDGIRLVYSYSGLYAKVLESDVSISYPDELLRSYKEQGVNAIWLPAVLYQLVEFPFDKSYSVGYEERRVRLRELIARANRFGIKVFLYLNEPRCMPLGFFEKHPDLLGASTTYNGALCSSDTRTSEYLTWAVKELCESVGGIGGFFLITCSENLTHCKSKKGEGTVGHCARCSDVPVKKLVSDVITNISDAAWSVDPNISIIAWTWAWDTFMSKDDMLECIASLPKGIIIQSNSEAQKPFVIGGVAGTVRDYSMSIPGPSDLAKEVWEFTAKNGHEVMAKVQVNDTWECSTLPFLPVFDLVREHMTALRQTGVGHVMLSWTLGGYPSVNLKIANECLKDSSEERYGDLLREIYGENAESVRRASKIFSDAFRRFPFDIRTLYNGPQNPGPSNLFYPEHSGFVSTMTCYAFDDIDGWRSIYPREVYINQLKLLSSGWKEGLRYIEDMPNGDLFKMCAYAAYYIFYSSYLQALFVDSRDKGDREKMLFAVKEDSKNAKSLFDLMQKCNLFGFEAANHYYYNKGMLAEKLVNCDFTKELLEKQIKNIDKHEKK